MKASKSIFSSKASKAVSTFNAKKNYSSFWMDDNDSIVSRYGGLSSEVKSSSDLFKLIKLSNYRRAITNFVKILTNMDIPVTWFGGGSYTDSKTINITSDIKDNNFDVTVGLALHEASHIKLTDFDVLRKMYNGECELTKQFSYSETSTIKEILNWIEDRRIDNFVFSTSPGYKAYYHKLYDYYWNDKSIDKGFKSAKYNDATQVESYMFHIINMLNPLFNSKALPGLDQIARLIDVKNISRLQSTYEVLEISVAVFNIIANNVAAAKNAPNQQDNQNAQQSEESNEEQQAQDQDQGTGASDQGSESKEESNENKEGGSQDGEGSESGEAQQDNNQELSDKEQKAIQNALDKMRKFLNGETQKKVATKKLQQQLKATADSNMEIQSVGGESGVGNTSTLLIDTINNNNLNEYFAKGEEVKRLRDLPWGHEDKKNLQALKLEIENSTLREFFGEAADNQYTTAVTKGYEMGALLGKKLQLHNESRERVDNRLRNGKIDNRRLAHAGYGIDNIFQQISIDKYKKANLHISLDGSGSMNGTKWASAIQMTSAIAKAVSYTQNINLQISIRCTTSGSSEAPVILNIYNSRKNNLKQLQQALSHYRVSSMTPEGLCFEAMYKKNQLVPGTSDMDSYFLNISDGMPGMSNGREYYGGESAVNHTAKWVNKMINERNIKLMSFYLSDYCSDYNRMVESFQRSRDGQYFRAMYGKDASVVNSDNVLDIAKQLNKKFMSK